MKVIATYSIKGGVGKTTTAVNLAHVAANTGARVLLWDLDPQGGASFLVRVVPSLKGGVGKLLSKKGSLAAHVRATSNPSLDVVPSDFSLRHLDIHLDGVKHPKQCVAALLEPLGDEYDLVVLDCAPGITLASESVFDAADALIVPTIPTPLSRRTLEQLRSFLADRPTRPLLLPFVSMIDRRKHLHLEVMDELKRSVPGFLPTAIPDASIVERAAAERVPVQTLAPGSPPAAAFRKLWSDIVERLW